MSVIGPIGIVFSKASSLSVLRRSSVNPVRKLSHDRKSVCPETFPKGTCSVSNYRLREIIGAAEKLMALKDEILGDDLLVNRLRARA